jgi:hypothetical protein
MVFTAQRGVGPTRNFERVHMNIDTVSSTKLRGALLAAFSLDGVMPAPANVETVEAVTNVLCAFGEVIAAAAFPAMPMIEGIAVQADETPALILAELRGLRADLAARSSEGAPRSDAQPIVDGAKLPPWMAQLAAASLCHLVEIDSQGLTLAAAGEALTAALLRLNESTLRSS